MLRSDTPRQGVQAIRLASKDKTVHIATHFDAASGSEIVLWTDVLVVFRGALYLQQETRVIPFLKGSDFKDLDPLRFACVPGVVLDVVLEDQPVETESNSSTKQRLQETLPASPQEISPSIATANHATGRSPQYGLVEVAMSNYTHIEVPPTNLPGPQLYPTNNEADSSNPTNPSSLDTARQSRSSQESRTVDPYKDIVKTTIRASQGDPKAQVVLGDIYANGEGVEKDYQAAMDWFLKAAEQGDAEGQRKVGWMHSEGLGVPVDYNESMEWLLKSAAQGDPPACHRIAGAYYYGEGVPVDKVKAAEWTLKAAEKGAPNSQFNIGRMYHNGEGVSQNFSLAVEWFRKAADQGDAHAQVSLGFMYEHGNGVSEDTEEAMAWFQKAAEQGQPLAVERLKQEASKRGIVSIDQGSQQGHAQRKKSSILGSFNKLFSTLR
ncbi:hypothetical protein BGW39_004907 [Mortierella sp. 14UC]|nr:hypothetical protein BGW39_004907 [Mortierella sp. 14UC]